MAVVIENGPVYRCSSHAVVYWLMACFALGGFACLLLASPVSHVQWVKTQTVLAPGMSAISDAETSIENGYATTRIHLLQAGNAPIQATLTMIDAADRLVRVETVTITPAELKRQGGWIALSSLVTSDIARAVVGLSPARSSDSAR